MPRTRGLEAHVGLEYPFHVRGGNAGAAIFDAHFNRVAFVFDPQVDICPAVAARVLKEIGEAPPDCLRLGEDRRCGFAVHRDPRPKRLHVLDHAFKKGVKVQPHGFFRRRARAQVFERAADHRVHLGKVVLDLRAQFSLRQSFQAQAQAGERQAQVVRHAGQRMGPRFEIAA